MFEIRDLYDYIFMVSPAIYFRIDKEDYYIKAKLIWQISKHNGFINYNDLPDITATVPELIADNIQDKTIMAAALYIQKYKIPLLNIIGTGILQDTLSEIEDNQCMEN